MEDEEAEDVQEMCTSQKEQKNKFVQTRMKLARVRAGAGQRSFRMGIENVPGRLVLFIRYL